MAPLYHIRTGAAISDYRLAFPGGICHHRRMKNILALAASLCIAAAVAEKPSISELPVTVEPAKGYNAWPMVQAVKDRLICVYTAGKRHDPGEKGRGTYARTSLDGGRIWLERQTVSVDARCGESPVAKGLDENGSALFWVRRFGPKPLMGLYRTDDGERFELISEPKLQGPMMQITDVMHIPGKGLMCFWFGGSYANDMKKRHWGVITSADNGKTWTQRILGADMPKSEWPTEPSGVYIGDGRILAIARTEAGGQPQFQLTSTDFGETWTVRKTNIRDVGASTPSLIYDPKTGLVSNYYYHRGPGVLRRRTVKASEIFDRPDAWPDPETLVADGGYSIDSGNANATFSGGMHHVAYYTGRAPDTSVMVLTLPPAGK